MSALQRSTFVFVCLLVATAVGILTVLGELVGTSMIMSPGPVLLGMVFAALEIGLVFLLCRSLSLWPRTRGGTCVLWPLCALLWGSGVALFFVIVMTGPLSAFTEATHSTVFDASFAGAWPEEIVKGLGALTVLLAFQQLNRPWHGVVVGALVGVGFEAIENVLYGATGGLQDPNSDMAGALGMWVARMIYGPFIHVCLSALVGYGLGRALYDAHRATSRRYLTVLGWWAVAFGLHFCWNITTDPSPLAYARIIVVAVVLYGLTFMVVRRANKEAKAHPEPALPHQPYDSPDGALSAPADEGSSGAAAPWAHAVGNSMRSMSPRRGAPRASQQWG